MYSETVGRSDTLTINALHDFAKMYLLQGNVKQAELMYAASLKASEMKYGKNHSENISIMIELATTLYRANKTKYAINMYRAALQIHITAFGRSHPDTILFQEQFNQIMINHARRSGVVVSAVPKLKSLRETPGKGVAITISSIAEGDEENEENDENGSSNFDSLKTAIKNTTQSVLGTFTKANPTLQSKSAKADIGTVTETYAITVPETFV